MMFVVTYRDTMGSMREKCVEATNRVDCIMSLKSQGVTPIKIRPSGKNVTREGHSSPFSRILLPFVLLATVVGGVWWWSINGNTPQLNNSGEDAQCQHTDVTVVKPESDPIPSQKTVEVSSSHLDQREASHDVVAQQASETNIPSSVNVQASKPRKRAFNTATEEVLHMLARTTPGDSPPPIPNLPRCENLKQILDSQIVIDKGDSDAVERAKRDVATLKAHLEKYIAEGGDPNDFVRFYRNWLLECSELRSSYERHVRKTLKTEGRRQAAIDLKVLNEKLKEQGIKPVVLPQRLWDAAQE